MAFAVSVVWRLDFEEFRVVPGFEILCLRSHPVKPAGRTPAQRVLIRAKSDLSYVSAVLGDTGAGYAVLHARVTTAGPWEEFPASCP